MPSRLPLTVQGLVAKDHFFVTYHGVALNDSMVQVRPGSCPPNVSRFFFTWIPREIGLHLALIGSFMHRV